MAGTPGADSAIHRSFPVSVSTTMRRDRVEVGRLTGKLGALQARLAAGGSDPILTRDPRRILYELYMLVRMRFARRSIYRS